jgi:hypothetical protein
MSVNKVAPATGDLIDDNKEFAGFHVNTMKQAQLPEQVEKEALLEGETAIASYDVLFPDIYFPLHVIIWNCIMTCGLFLCGLLVRKAQRERWCCGYCKPQNLYVRRGKMIVTSKGRVITWEQDMQQSYVEEVDGCTKALQCMFGCCCKETCDAPMNYNVSLRTVIYNLRDVSQVSQFFQSEACCSCLSFSQCCAGCLDFTSGIKMNFFNFDSSPSIEGAFVNTLTNTQAWIQSIRSITGLAFSASMAPMSDPRTDHLMILSKGMEKYHFENPRSTLEELSALHGDVMNHVQKYLGEVWNTNDDIFCPLGKQDKKFQVVADKPDVQIVADDRTVSLPENYIHLGKGEQIIDCRGIVYIPSCLDWVLIVLTFGYYYFAFIRKRKFCRTAIAVTNKRLLVIDIVQRAGVIPNHLTNFSLQVRSFFMPGISAGYVGMSPKWVHSSICCNNGALELVLDPMDADFAKKLTNVVTRKKLGVNYSAGFNPVGPVPGAKAALSQRDMEYLPLKESETILVRHKGPDGGKEVYKETYEECCRVINQYDLSGETDCRPCYHSAANPWFPLGALLCSCGYRPKYNVEDVIITDHTMYYINASIVDCFCGRSCVNEDAYVSVWTPIRNFSGIDTRLKVAGAETPITRFMNKFCCGFVKPCVNIFCKLTDTVLAMDFAFVQQGSLMKFPTITITFRDNHHWKEDSHLVGTRQAASQIQGAIFDELEGGEQKA